MNLQIPILHIQRLLNKNSHSWNLILINLNKKYIIMKIKDIFLHLFLKWLGFKTKMQSFIQLLTKRLRQLETMNFLSEYLKASLNVVKGKSRIILDRKHKQIKLGIEFKATNQPQSLPKTIDKQTCLHLEDIELSPKQQALFQTEVQCSLKGLSTKEINPKCKLRRQQIMRLKRQNQKLVSIHSHMLNEKKDLQQFFEQAVEEIKRHIKIRKQISYCSLDEFRREDKISLMIKILSNDDILRYLHERIFMKRRASRKVDLKGYSSAITKDAVYTGEI